MPIYEIDDYTIEKVKSKFYSDTVKVINLIKSINVHILKNISIEPYLASIAEKAERIRQDFENRQKSTEQALAELERLINEINEAKKVRAEKDFDVHTFTIYWVLKEQGLGGHDALSKDLNSIFEQYPNWPVNSEQSRRLRASLYQKLLKPVGESKMFEIVEKLLDLRRELSKRTEQVENG